MSKNNGGLAFPTDGKIQHGTEYDGMSLRDWLAGQAMAAIISKIELKGSGTSGEDGEVVEPEERMRVIMGSAARGAYGYADAMLEAREK